MSRRRLIGLRAARQHGMSVGAAWRLDKLEQGASGENTQLVRDEVSITQDGYVCVRQLKSNFSE